MDETLRQELAETRRLLIEAYKECNHLYKEIETLRKLLTSVKPYGELHMESQSKQWDGTGIETVRFY